MCTDGLEADAYYKQIAADILIALIEAEADELKLQLETGKGEAEEYEDISADRCIEYYNKILATVRGE